MTDNKYTIVRNQPVARFFYKGQSHTHPVRRTVVLIESTPTLLKGYELREGANVRQLGRAPIKTYRKTSIAKIGEIDARRTLRTSASAKELAKSTLNRMSFDNLVKDGI